MPESCQSRNDAPHVPAAFINAIAEEGTKAEAIEWLQKTWNELCRAESELRALRHDMERAQHNHAADLACAGSEIPCCGETPCQWGDHPCERKKVPASPSDKHSALAAEIERIGLEWHKGGILGQAHVDLIVAALRACTHSAELRSEPVLDKKAQIGATVFGVGVKWSTVIDRAQREWDYFHGLENPRSMRSHVLRSEPPVIFSAGKWAYLGNENTPASEHDSRELDAAAWHKLCAGSATGDRKPE